MTHYLVLLRCFSTDVPLHLTDDPDEATRFVDDWSEDQMTGLHLDSWSTKYPSNLTIVEFKNGKPVDSTCMREFDVTEGWFDTP